MGAVNVSLKRSFIVLATVIGACSALMLAFTLFHHGYMHQDDEIEKIIGGLSLSYAVNNLNLLLAVAGVFGACKAKKWALIVFAVGMILVSLIMLFCITMSLAGLPQLVEDVKRNYMDLVKTTNSTLLELFDEAQRPFQCCGSDQGYAEWGYDIPESCVCTEISTNPCVAAPRNSSLFEQHSGDQPIMIYQEPCLPHVTDYVMYIFTVVVVVILGVVMLWVVAVVLCIFILCQLSQKAETPAVRYNQEAKAGIYTILANSDNFT